MAQINQHVRLRDKCRCFTNILSNSCHLSIRVIRDLKAQYVNYLVKIQIFYEVDQAVDQNLSFLNYISYSYYTIWIPIQILKSGQVSTLNVLDYLTQWW